MSIENEPTQLHYVLMRRGVLDYGTALPGEPAPNIWRACDGGKEPAEAVSSALPTIESAWAFAKNCEVGWYAALYERWGGGPYEGDQDIDWKVFYGPRPTQSSSFDFACGPWETEEQAIDAKNRFANGLPFTWHDDTEGVEIEGEEYDPDTGDYLTETIYYSGMRYDAGILDTYPVRPPADMSHLPPLSTN